jgi:hypothetical protein
MRTLLLVVAICGLPGCMVQMVRVGPRYPPRAADCPVAFAYASLDALRAQYELVGLICTGPLEDEFSDALRERLQAPACAAGGELVVIRGFCLIGKANGVELAVLRRRDSQVEWDEPAPR